VSCTENIGDSIKLFYVHSVS